MLFGSKPRKPHGDLETDLWRRDRSWSECLHTKESLLPWILPSTVYTSRPRVDWTPQDKELQAPPPALEALESFWNTGTSFSWAQRKWRSKVSKFLFEFGGTSPTREQNQASAERLSPMAPTADTTFGRKWGGGAGIHFTTEWYPETCCCFFFPSSHPLSAGVH